MCLNKWQDLGFKTATAAKTACTNGKSLPTIRKQEELLEIQAQIGKTSKDDSQTGKNHNKENPKNLKFLNFSKVVLIDHSCLQHTILEL